jgi:crotonobetainyl-CoA:carnitine CoA-transferase CaiB-like acyl-CoA transferase
MSGPLEGVRVLELSSVVLGPWACQILGDLGADVVKIEPPAGDSNRYIGPARHPLMGALFLTCNRNKRSVVLDLKHPDGRDAALRLASRADVLVHNIRPAAIARLGLDYDAVRRVSPSIVYCGTCGFARRGPWADKPAYDDSIQSASGLAALQATLDGEPRYVPTIVADKTTALAVVGAVTAALFHRARTGVGQEIEVPMYETLVSFVMAEHLFGRAFEPAEGDAGYTRLLTPHRRPYRTRDGYLSVLPYLDEHWRRFCACAGQPALADDPVYATLRARQANIDEVYATTARLVAERTTGEWIDLLEPEGIPVMPVASLDDVLASPQLEATGFWSLFDHPTEGRLRMPGIPTGFSATPASIRRPPPRLGEHSLEVLREAGVDAARIATMLADGTTLQADPA